MFSPLREEWGNRGMKRISTSPRVPEGGHGALALKPGRWLQAWASPARHQALLLVPHVSAPGPASLCPAARCFPPARHRLSSFPRTHELSWMQMSSRHHSEPKRKNTQSWYQRSASENAEIRATAEHAPLRVQASSRAPGLSVPAWGRSWNRDPWRAECCLRLSATVWSWESSSASRPWFPHW